MLQPRHVGLQQPANPRRPPPHLVLVVRCQHRCLPRHEHLALYLLADHAQQREQLAQPHAPVVGQRQVEVHQGGLGRVESHRGEGQAQPVLPRFDSLERPPHQAGLGALQAVAPPVEPGQVVDLLVEEGVAGAEGIAQLLLQSFELGRVFAQGAHHFVVIFGSGTLAVFDAVHFGIVLTGHGARTVGTPGIRAGGVEQLRRKLRRIADRHSIS